MKEFSLTRPLSILITGCGALVGFGHVTRAGSWSGPVYTVKVRVPAPPAGTQNNVPSDSFFTNGNTGTTASGTVSAKFTWTPDPATPNEKAPEAVLIEQTASAAWVGVSHDTGPAPVPTDPVFERAHSPSYSYSAWQKHSNFRIIPIQLQQGTTTGTASNSLKNNYIETKNAQGVTVSGNSSGIIVDAYDVAADHTVTLDDVHLEATVNPAGHLQWSYSASIVPVSFQLSPSWSNGNFFPNTIGAPPYNTPVPYMTRDANDPDAPAQEHQNSWVELKAQLPQGIGVYLETSSFNVSSSIESILTVIDATGGLIDTDNEGTRTDPAYPNPGNTVYYINAGDIIFFNDGPGPITQNMVATLRAGKAADNTVDKVLLTQNFTSQL